ncbi:hypothetical protein [Sphingobacterium athyrii]|uniref:Uncharacterized protein n=1 Tax=Sphingobacterium athyrii TaxID=2152717 RepID=A0A363NZY3_9SPHI|nr:hypothetical protein [Sphingobacterium athyrii]PUV26307.1 hypothetical protein DCO56_04975 [Sphingobacterium athyrii]
MANQILIKNTMADMRGLSAAEITALKNGTYEGVKLLGYYKKGDTPAPIIYYYSATEQGGDDGGSVIVVGGIKLQIIFKEKVNALYFGISTTLSDNFDQLSAFFNYLKINGSVMGIMPAGTILYSQTINFAFDGGRLVGQGVKTILQFTGVADNAFEFNAFTGGDVADQHARGMIISNFIISGNENTKNTIFVQGISRGQFENVWCGNGKPASDGFGWLIASSHLNEFTRCGFTDNHFKHTSKPMWGMVLSVGHRNGETYGNSTNNTFRNCYFEGTSYGLNIANGDQNYFIGGSPEANSIYGLVIGINSKFNTFIGVGFENKNAIDIVDNGKMTSFIGCYAYSEVRFGSTCLGSKFEGGYAQKIDVQAGARNVVLSRINYSHWKEGGQIVDNGTNTKKELITKLNTDEYLRDNLQLTGILKADAIKLKTLNNSSLINTTDSEGGFTPFIATNNEFFASNGCGLAVDRTSNFDTTNSISSFKIFSKSDTNSKLFFTKKIAATGSTTDWSSLKEFVFRDDLASLNGRGLVSQSVAVRDSSVQNSTTSFLPDAIDLPTSLELLNDLKSKYNQSVELINELKQLLNSKFQADRNSGQQSG